MAFSTALRAALFSFAFATLASAVSTGELASRAPDPCALIGGKKWVSPKEVRACYTSFKVDDVAKAKTIDTLVKGLAFHTSVNYQIQAPPPFAGDVHEDLLADLARIKKQKYASEYDLHIDLSRSFKRLNDGHCVWVNYCYDSLFVNYLPIPVTLITDKLGFQNMHIAYEAFDVASAEFADQIDFWQNALPGSLKGNLQSLSGAKVLLINGLPPQVAIDANAKIAGSFQGLGTRQNGFFSSYRRNAGEWSYIMGNFAQQSLPLDDSVLLTIQRVNHTLPDTVIIPYRSRLGSTAEPFADTASWRANNCQAVDDTNGVDLYANKGVPGLAAAKFQQQTPVPPAVQREHLMNVILDTAPLSDVTLPPTLLPKLSPLGGSRNSAQFYLAKDGKTGVLALGSFSDSSFTGLLTSLLSGLKSLKDAGATQLVIDVTNNGGGFICAAHWLHRIIAGPKAETVPQAGLDSAARNGPLAQLITKAIVEKNVDPDQKLLYHPVNWRNATHDLFTGKQDWLQPPELRIINGRKDYFSQRLGQECQPEGFIEGAPDIALFDPKKVVIVSNGRQGLRPYHARMRKLLLPVQCEYENLIRGDDRPMGLPQIVMAELEGTKTVVVGGKKDVKQQYCGIVGGQSTDFATIDSEIKTAGLKNNTLAPPDLIVNGVMGITWRLAFSPNSNTPAEWEDHAADFNLPLTPELANNPVAIWEAVTKLALL